MKFYRKAIEKLSEWQNKPNRKPLVLRGARQVGKSTLVRQFSKRFDYYVELNLERKEDASFFNEFKNVLQLVEAACLSKNIPFAPTKTLLFIDEIQQVPEATAMLRYFYEDLPDLHIIAAGSLLEFAMGDVSAMPVGRVELLKLHPMDFEEFLLACDEQKALLYWKEVPMKDLALNKLMGLFNRYLIVGGMPAVVEQYVTNGKMLNGLGEAYASIWDVYKNDIEKYGKNDTARRILRHIINTAPFVKERITFAGFGNSQYKSREVGEAFRALDLAGVIQLIYPTTNTTIPLLPDLKRKPKMQFLDTGLVNYACDLHAEMTFISDFSDFYRGYIINHMAVQEIMAQQSRIDYRPVFWVREKPTANAEVDMVVKWKNLAIPVEIKSGPTGRLRSLHEYMDVCPHNYAVRLLHNKIQIEKVTTRGGKVFHLLNLPYCNASQIEAYMDWFEKQKI